MPLILFKCKECKFRRYALLGGINIRGESADVIVNHAKQKKHTLLVGPGEIAYKYDAAHERLEAVK